MTQPPPTAAPRPAMDGQPASPGCVARLTDVHHAYGRHPVLKGIDLDVGRGECVVLFGSNGSGKSTLLAILSTRYGLRRGRYLLDGLDVGAQGEEARGKLLFVGHHTHLYGHLTPLENLLFFAELRGFTPSGERLREVLATVGLSGVADKPVAWFSAGMKKRLALGRMLLARPLLLLLDEPYSALDAQGVAWLNGMLVRYLEEGGAVVMASHDPERVAALPHRPHLLARGLLQPGDFRPC